MARNKQSVYLAHQLGTPARVDCRAGIACQHPFPLTPSQLNFLLPCGYHAMTYCPVLAPRLMLFLTNMALPYPGEESEGRRRGKSKRYTTTGTNPLPRPLYPGSAPTRHPGHQGWLLTHAKPPHTLFTPFVSVSQSPITPNCKDRDFAVYVLDRNSVLPVAPMPHS